MVGPPAVVTRAININECEKVLPGEECSTHSKKTFNRSQTCVLRQYDPVGNEHKIKSEEASMS
ncbi:hypothetical protein C0J52_13787 [Blattella germanica]|nr:hypothetical protein C0J52_13787 [Blattella germanica]